MPERVLTQRELNRALLAPQLLLERSRLPVVRAVRLRGSLDPAREFRPRRADTGARTPPGRPGNAHADDDPPRLRRRLPALPRRGAGRPPRAVAEGTPRQS